MRDDRLDAVKAVALAGVLQVNIQTFAWPLHNPLGVLAAANWFDTFVYFLLGVFIWSKCLGIFAVLFGAGLATQLARDTSGEKVRRRLMFLLGIGLLHAVFLYFGDILVIYALCGLLLVAMQRHLDQRQRGWLQWRRPILVLGGLTVASFGVVLYAAISADSGSAPELWRLHRVVTTGSFADQIPARADALLLQWGSALFYAPLLMALMSLGFCARTAGWLCTPVHSHGHARTIRLLGTAGLTLSLIATGLAYIAVGRSQTEWTTAATGIIAAGGVLAVPMYLRGLLSFFESRAGQPLQRLLAPVGRWSLWNYLGQSFLMGVLLSGWGLGLGHALGTADLAALALAISGVQIALSRCVAQARLSRTTPGHSF